MTNLTRLSIYAALCGIDGAQAMGEWSSPLNRSDLECVAAKCREAYLDETLPRLKADNRSIATCLPCSQSANCTQTMLDTTNVPVPPGWWRTNEFSRDFRPCRPEGACIGTDDILRGADTLCREGHMGPLCASCLDNYFRSHKEECVLCDTLNWSAIYGLVFMSVLLLLLLLTLLVKGRHFPSQVYSPSQGLATASTSLG